MVSISVVFSACSMAKPAFGCLCSRARRPRMQGPPALFDTDLLARRRARAARLGPADFLHAAVAGEIAERLREVNRDRFAPPPSSARAPALWARRSPRPGWRAPGRWPMPRCCRSTRRRTTSSCTRSRCTGRTTRSGSSCRRAARSGPTGSSSRRSSAARRCNELRAALAEAEVATLGGLSPRVAPMGEIRDLGGLLQRAGFALPVADSRRFDVSYPTPVRADARPAGDGRDQRDARPAAPADARARCWPGPARSTPTGSGSPTAGCRRPSR